ncbi:unnamed protein product [Amoebophrya sp. A120]|nr:unnamed protein product [Amoebophrya sp. A120]|eukprot:GSA120T00004415001.1
MRSRTRMWLLCCSILVTAGSVTSAATPAAATSRLIFHYVPQYQKKCFKRSDFFSDEDAAQTAARDPNVERTELSVLGLVGNPSLMLENAADETTLQATSAEGAAAAKKARTPDPLRYGSFDATMVDLASSAATDICVATLSEPGCSFLVVATGVNAAVPLGVVPTSSITRLQNGLPSVVSWPDYYASGRKKNADATTGVKNLRWFKFEYGRPAHSLETAVQIELLQFAAPEILNAEMALMEQDFAPARVLNVYRIDKTSSSSTTSSTSQELRDPLASYPLDFQGNRVWKLTLPTSVADHEKSESKDGVTSSRREELLLSIEDQLVNSDMITGAAAPSSKIAGNVAPVDGDSDMQYTPAMVLTVTANPESAALALAAANSENKVSDGQNQAEAAPIAARLVPHGVPARGYIEVPADVAPTAKVCAPIRYSTLFHAATDLTISLVTDDSNDFASSTAGSSAVASSKVATTWHLRAKAAPDLWSADSSPSLSTALSSTKTSAVGAAASAAIAEGESVMSAVSSTIKKSWSSVFGSGTSSSSASKTSETSADQIPAGSYLGAKLDISRTELAALSGSTTSASMTESGPVQMSNQLEIDVCLEGGAKLDKTSSSESSTTVAADENLLGGVAKKNPTGDESKTPGTIYFFELLVVSASEMITLEPGKPVTATIQSNHWQDFRIFVPPPTSVATQNPNYALTLSTHGENHARTYLVADVRHFARDPRAYRWKSGAQEDAGVDETIVLSPLHRVCKYGGMVHRKLCFVYVSTFAWFPEDGERGKSDNPLKDQAAEFTISATFNSPNSAGTDVSPAKGAAFSPKDGDDGSNLPVDAGDITATSNALQKHLVLREGVSQDVVTSSADTASVFKFEVDKRDEGIVVGLEHLEGRCRVKISAFDDVASDPTADGVAATPYADDAVLLTPGSPVLTEAANIAAAETNVASGVLDAGSAADASTGTAAAPASKSGVPVVPMKLFISVKAASAEKQMDAGETSTKASPSAHCRLTARGTRFVSPLQDGATVSGAVRPQFLNFFSVDPLDFRNSGANGIDLQLNVLAGGVDLCVKYGSSAAENKDAADASQNEMDSIAAHHCDLRTDTVSGRSALRLFAVAPSSLSTAAAAVENAITSVLPGTPTSIGPEQTKKARVIVFAREDTPSAYSLTASAKNTVATLLDGAPTEIFLSAEDAAATSSSTSSSALVKKTFKIAEGLSSTRTRFRLRVSNGGPVQVCFQAYLRDDSFGSNAKNGITLVPQIQIAGTAGLAADHSDLSGDASSAAIVYDWGRSAGATVGDNSDAVGTTAAPSTTGEDADSDKLKAALSGDGQSSSSSQTTSGAILSSLKSLAVGGIMGSSSTPGDVDTPEKKLFTPLVCLPNRTVTRFAAVDVMKPPPDLLDVIQDLRVHVSLADSTSTSGSEATSASVVLFSQRSNDVVLRDGQQVMDRIFALASANVGTVVASEYTNKNDFLPGTTYYRFFLFPTANFLLKALQIELTLDDSTAATASALASTLSCVSMGFSVLPTDDEDEEPANERGAAAQAAADQNLQLAEQIRIKESPKTSATKSLTATLPAYLVFQYRQRWLRIRVENRCSAQQANLKSLQYTVQVKSKNFFDSFSSTTKDVKPVKLVLDAPPQLVTFDDRDDDFGLASPDFYHVDLPANKAPAETMSPELKKKEEEDMKTALAMQKSADVNSGEGKSSLGAAAAKAVETVADNLEAAKEAVETKVDDLKTSVEDSVQNAKNKVEDAAKMTANKVMQLAPVSVIKPFSLSTDNDRVLRVDVCYGRVVVATGATVENLNVEHDDAASATRGSFSWSTVLGGKTEYVAVREARQEGDDTGAGGVMQPSASASASNTNSASSSSSDAEATSSSTIFSDSVLSQTLQPSYEISLKLSGAEQSSSSGSRFDLQLDKYGAFQYQSSAADSPQYDMLVLLDPDNAQTTNLRPETRCGFETLLAAVLEEKRWDANPRPLLRSQNNLLARRDTAAQVFFSRGSLLVLQPPLEQSGESSSKDGSATTIPLQDLLQQPQVASNLKSWASVAAVVMNTKTKALSKPLRFPASDLLTGVGVSSSEADVGAPRSFSMTVIVGLFKIFCIYLLVVFFLGRCLGISNWRKNYVYRRLFYFWDRVSVAVCGRRGRSSVDDDLFLDETTLDGNASPDAYHLPMVLEQDQAQARRRNGSGQQQTGGSYVPPKLGVEGAGTGKSSNAGFVFRSGTGSSSTTSGAATTAMGGNFSSAVAAANTAFVLSSGPVPVTSAESLRTNASLDESFANTYHTL